jgi:hypothetical protein
MTFLFFNFIKKLLLAGFGVPVLELLPFEGFSTHFDLTGIIELVNPSKIG